MNTRALAFLQEMIRTALAKIHTCDMSCDESLFAPFDRVYMADSTGFELPDSLKSPFLGREVVPGKRERKFSWCGTTRSSAFAHFALIPGISLTRNISIR